jgi:hypothetical protein
MLTLNQDVYLIVDQDGQVEYDYDGPMIESADGPPGKYLADSLSYFKQTHKRFRNHRIVKAKLIEIP